MHSSDCHVPEFCRARLRKQRLPLIAAVVLRLQARVRGCDRLVGVRHAWLDALAIERFDPLV